MRQERVQKVVIPRNVRGRVSNEVLFVPVVTEEFKDSGDKLKSELDNLLDEIDEVLEVNAEEFVASYIQKGGE